MYSILHHLSLNEQLFDFNLFTQNKALHVLTYDGPNEQIQYINLKYH